jgi:hypothetical protein
MNIAFIEPLSRAWNRMKIALFKPFDLNKWFVVGFTAFLAGLTRGPGGSGSGGRGGHLSFREFLDLPNRAWAWLMNHPGWFIAIVFIVMFLIIIGITFTWLSSRGKFMFLDNVVHERAEIAKPWKRFKREGNSLFLWRLCFGLICFILFIMFFVFFFTMASHLYEGSYFQRVPVGFIVGMILLFLLMIIVIGYISLFLDSFVIPIMHKNNIKTTQAWSRFLSILGQYPFHFIFYGLLMFGLMILFVISVIIAGLLTCLIGFLFLIIPYIGTVVTLPVWYTFRAFSLEFLAQFGPEYELFPSPEASSISAQS